MKRPQRKQGLQQKRLRNLQKKNVSQKKRPPELLRHRGLLMKRPQRKQGLQQKRPQNLQRNNVSPKKRPRELPKHNVSPKLKLKRSKRSSQY